MDNFFIWAKEVIGIGPRNMKLFYEENKDGLEEIFMDVDYKGSVGGSVSQTRLMDSAGQIGSRDFIGWILDLGQTYFSKKIMDKISKYGYDQALIDEIKNNVRINKASYVCYDSEDYPALLRNV